MPMHTFPSFLSPYLATPTIPQDRLALSFERVEPLLPKWTRRVLG